MKFEDTPVRENLQNEAGSHKICQDSPDFILDVLFNFEKYDSKKVKISYFHNLKSFTSIFVFLRNFTAVKISLPPLRPSPHIQMFIFSNLFLLNFAAPLRFSSLFLGLFTRELGGQSASYPSLHPKIGKYVGPLTARKKEI